MKRIKGVFTYFSKGELLLWLGSLTVVLAAFFLFDRESYLSLSASLIGVTSLIFNAKGNPLGQLLMIIFSVLYGIISFGFAYYGEMVTYIGMTLPMAAFALVSWLRNPYKGRRSQVKVNSIGKRELISSLMLTVAVTLIFYFILEFFSTANIIPSTISVATSFFAAYLTFRRSPYFALAYALNDVVLLILWSLACLQDISYVSVLVCFAVFLVNDLYGFYNWTKMQRNQKL